MHLPGRHTVLFDGLWVMTTICRFRHGSMDKDIDLYLSKLLIYYLGFFFFFFFTFFDFPSLDPNQ